MRKILLIVFIQCFLVVLTKAQSDTIKYQNGYVAEVPVEKKKKDKLKRYNGNQWTDTVIVKGKMLTPTKKELKKNFRDIVLKSDSIELNGDMLDVHKAHQIVRKNYRDSVRAHKNVWGSILGGPSYTPESSLGLAAVALLTFKFDKSDTVSHRSSVPVGIMFTINNSFMLSGVGKFYLKENRLRVSVDYSISHEPDNFYGVGIDQIKNVSKGKNTTQFNKFELKLYPTVLWEVREDLFLGGAIDYTYYNIRDVNEVMAENSYFKKFAPKYLNSGIGVNLLYDSRDNMTMPYSGIYAEFKSMVYGKYLGGRYNFTYNKFDYRQYKRLFNRRSVLAWTARVDITTGDVPITNLATFGSPRDLRGYYVGQYRDKSMGYVMAEYRHMFGSTAVYESRRPIWSRLGFAVWAGMGTLGPDPIHFNTFKGNYGIGLRYEIQPNSNVRFDLGRGPKGQWLFYMNMIEAF